MGKLVSQLKEFNQDFEWYPTTDAIISCIKHDIETAFSHKWHSKSTGSLTILDCGAGDGRVLKALTKGEMFAIEKSPLLINSMPNDIFIAGTDLFDNTLIDKKVDIIFSNPPYSEFVIWATKIIKEADASLIYLVLPERWKNSEDIRHAVVSRDAVAQVVSSFNFFNAERRARANVDVIRVNLKEDIWQDKPNTDPFTLWFNEAFEKEKEPGKKAPKAETFQERIQSNIVPGKGILPTLVMLYERDLQNLQNNFQALCQLDSALLSAMDIDLSNVKAVLSSKIKGLKNKYWLEFLNNYKPVTDRLTVRTRKVIMAQLRGNTNVDFTEDNAFAVTSWVLRSANMYFDEQLCTLAEELSERANVILYTSNKRLYTDDDWRWCNNPRGGIDRYSLELRMVLHNRGGAKSDSDYSFSYDQGLATMAHDFIGDILTVANNLGFPCLESSRYVVDSGFRDKREWLPGKKQLFHTGDAILMEVKAFMNGNLHIKFNQDLIRNINVEFGRLKGWLKSAEEASEELNLAPDIVKRFFKTNFVLQTSSEIKQICG